MQVRFVFNSRIAKTLGVGAIVLYPFVFFSMPRANATDRLIHHEWTHIRQVRKNGWLKFYASYIYEFTKHLLKLRNPNQAYLAISYEREAYASEAAVTLNEAEAQELRTAIG